MPGQDGAEQAGPAKTKIDTVIALLELVDGASIEETSCFYEALRLLCERPASRFRSGPEIRTVWCGREDSNFHGLSATTTSTLRVYQFRHDRTQSKRAAPMCGPR